MAKTTKPAKKEAPRVDASQAKTATNKKESLSNVTTSTSTPARSDEPAKQAAPVTSQVGKAQMLAKEEEVRLRAGRLDNAPDTKRSADGAAGIVHPATETDMDIEGDPEMKRAMQEQFSTEADGSALAANKTSTKGEQAARGQKEKRVTVTINDESVSSIAVRGENSQRRRVPTGKPVDISESEMAYLDRTKTPYTSGKRA